MVDSVFIIDDHPVFREGLKHIIEEDTQLDVAGTGANSMKDVACMEKTSPDIVTVDLNLGKGQGLRLIKSIRQRYPDIKILVVSTHNESNYAERCVRAGANGFINKDQPGENIAMAIKMVLRGELYLSREISQHIVLRQLRGEFTYAEHPEECLSDRELEVYALFGKGHTTQGIASHLNLSAKTVDTHREHIKKKLGIKYNSELIHQAVAWVLQCESA